MNEQKQREAMARLDEPPPMVEHEYPNGEIGLVPRLFTYDSHDDVQRVIDGLSAYELKDYCHYITDATGYTPHGIVKATPAQKREAILRAKGLWEEQP